MVTVTALRIADVKSIESPVHSDERGFFFEGWNARSLSAAGFHENFVQDNCVRSALGVVRGLHYQITKPQGKIIRVIQGEIFDVAVDMRGSSPTFGQWVGGRLSSEEHRALWVPPGFAHGYLALSETADVYYKCTEFWDAADERGVRWNDHAIGIGWPLGGIGAPIVSARDAVLPPLENAESYP